MKKREQCLSPDKRQQLREELEEIAERYDITAYLNMPDFLIASMLVEYIEDCKAILTTREKYLQIKH